MPVIPVQGLCGRSPGSQGHVENAARAGPQESHFRSGLIVGETLYRGLDQEGHLPAWYLPWLVSQLSVHQLHVVVH